MMVKRSLLALALSILSFNAKAAADTISFSGTVVHGQRYEHRISHLYFFVLTPQWDGWTIAVYTPNYPKSNLTDFSPPIHCCPFQQDIQARNFICCSNFTMRFPRRVIFSVRALHTPYPPDLSDIVAIAKDGSAEVTISDVRLGNLTDPSRAYIKRMNFKAVINYNPKPSWPKGKSTRGY